MLQPFLELFQANKPLLPFLCEEIRIIIINCLSLFRVLKEKSISELDSTYKLAKFDFEQPENFSSVEKVSLGFAGDRLLRGLNANVISQGKIIDMKREVQRFVTAFVTKIIEKSPLKYQLARNLVCLDTKYMVNDPDSAYKKMKIVLTNLAQAHRVKEADCENLLLSFNHFLNVCVMENSNDFREFNFKSPHASLDIFLEKYLNCTQYLELWNVIKILLILSHSQAAVERGFSINKNLERENLLQETYVAQRLVADFVKGDNDISKIEITKEMRASVSAARQRYHEHLEKKIKKESTEVAQKRKRISDTLTQLGAKKSRLEMSIKELTKSADKLAEKAEDSNDLKYIAQSNSFRRSAKEKTNELIDVEKEIKANEELLKKH